MKVEFHSNNNSWVITIDDTIRYNGEYSYKNNEEFKFLEFIGEVVLDKKVKVEYR